MKIKFLSQISKKNSYTKSQNNYLNRFTHFPLKKKIRNVAGAAFAILGLYTGSEFYENSYYKLDKNGDINYVKPEKKRFDTRKDAIDYAKVRIVEALNNDTPYEHLVNINNANNEILAEFKGNDKEVKGVLSLADLVKIIYQGKGYTMLHGHPENGNGLTNPLGFQDFTTLIENEHNTEVTAINRYGEVSGLRKTNDFTPLNEEQINDINNKIIDILTNSFRITQPKLYNKIIETYQQSTDSLEKEQLSQKFDSIVLLQDSTLYTNKYIHKFWKEYAPKLGLEYFTTFSKNTPKD